ncbi:MAG: phospholipase D-like domain-containing protein [Ktedonobacterales bacterium]
MKSFFRFFHSQDDDTSADTVRPFFLAQGEQTAEQVAARLVEFIGGAQHSLDIATYDFRLSDPLKAIVAGALGKRARAGVAIRIAYDGDKTSVPRFDVGMDPAPHGTSEFVQSLGYPKHRISGMKLMHNKYIVRDAGLPSAAVWTGSTNFSDASWTLQENNILEISSPALAAYYARDFADMWQSDSIEGAGDFDTAPIDLTYGGQTANVQVLFAPGRGEIIDHEVGHRVATARRRIRICSMLLNSSALLSSLTNQLREGRVAIDGIYDRTQMQSVLDQWQEVPHNHWKIEAVAEIVSQAHLAGKNSTPYSPDSVHDFMHNKVLVVDNTVITGSYNFSHNAELNAENLLIIESPALAETYSAYIDHLIRDYGNR